MWEREAVELLPGECCPCIMSQWVLGLFSISLGRVVVGALALGLESLGHKLITVSRYFERQWIVEDFFFTIGPVKA